MILLSGSAYAQSASKAKANPCGEARTCVADSVLLQAEADSKGVQLLDETLATLGNVRADLYKKDGQNFELNKQIAKLAYDNKAKDLEIMELNMRVKTLVDKEDSRVSFYVWMGIGVAIGLAGAGAVAIVLD